MLIPHPRVTGGLTAALLDSAWSERCDCMDQRLLGHAAAHVMRACKVRTDPWRASAMQLAGLRNEDRGPVAS